MMCIISNEFDFNNFENVTDRDIFDLLINTGSSYDESSS